MSKMSYGGVGGMSGGGAPYNKRERSLDDNGGYDHPPQKRMPPAMSGGYSQQPGGYNSMPVQQRGYSNSADGYQGGGFMAQSMHQPGQMRPMGPPQSIEEKGSHVLMFTIFNPKYPITVDVMHTICSADNRIVNRIVIFRKNGVQAMVEFDSIDAAERAKEALNGADIYSGCCTLKIEFAKPTRLNVVKNDTDTWDYTNPHLNKEPPKSVPLLPDPKFDPSLGDTYGAPRYPESGPPARRGPGGPMTDFGYDDDGYGRPGPESFEPFRRGGPQPLDRFPPQTGERFPQPGPVRLMEETFTDPYAAQRGMPVGRGVAPARGGVMPMARGGFQGGRGRGGPMGGGFPGGPGATGGGYEAAGDMSAGGTIEPGCVLMVYGCPDGKINCQRLFNLFCLYGNVLKVKFLKNKEGAAMIQMSDQASCARVLQHLGQTPMFGTKLTVGQSKQTFVQDVTRPVELSDGSISFEDFTGTRNNRFTTPETAAKNRVQPPSRMLYFFNAPAKMKDDDVIKIFVEADVKPPSKIKIFPSRNEKSCTGIVEFDSVSDCVEALVVCNNTTVPNPVGKMPFILKFSFSGSQGHNDGPRY